MSPACAVVTMVHVAVLAFIIAAGLVKARPANLAPFAPHGARGIFSGAAYVYFTYTGFDAVATSAEEVGGYCVKEGSGVSGAERLAGERAPAG